MLDDGHRISDHPPRPEKIPEFVDFASKFLGQH